MENFNIKRFCHTFRWLFRDRRNYLITYGLGLALVLLIIEVLFTHISINKIQTTELYSMVVNGLFGFCATVSWIAILFCMGNLFSFIKNKQKRIAFLTLPATNFERWLSALLMVVVVCPLFITVALFLADTLRMVIFALFGYEWYSCVKPLFTSFFSHDINWHFIKSQLFEFSILSWICSIYVLGGTWFKKRPFSIITFIMFTLLLMLAFIIYNLNKQGLHLNTELRETIIGLIAIGCALFSVLNIWLSYRIFKRFQIITSKWTNV